MPFSVGAVSTGQFTELGKGTRMVFWTPQHLPVQIWQIGRF